MTDRVDAHRLDRWAAATSAAVLQIDAIRDQPLRDTEYLVAFGRVWIRRDLLWIGLILWAPLVFRGLPGRWHGTTTETRRRRGREYLPGFGFRMLFLVSLILLPALATVLLYPAALLAWIPLSDRRRQRLIVGVLAFAPLLAFSTWIAWAQIGGYLALHPGAIFPLGLVAITLVAFWLWKIDQRPFQLA